jgi:hypothetical protein
VWECDPAGAGLGVIKPAMGTFNHEAACVDPAERRLYMTEDEPDGGFYRFTPESYPDLSSGLLEVALVDAQGAVTWEEVPDPTAIGGPTREQVPGMKTFDGGEGLWFDSGRVYFTTKGDNRVWEYDTTTARLTVLYDAAALGPDAPLTGVDNLTVTRAGEIYVCEDGGNMELCLITADRTVAPFLRLEGEAAEGLPDRGNELAGVAFSPRGDRMYFGPARLRLRRHLRGQRPVRRRPARPDRARPRPRPGRAPTRAAGRGAEPDPAGEPPPARARRARGARRARPRHARPAHGRPRARARQARLRPTSADRHPGARGAAAGARDPRRASSRRAAHSVAAAGAPRGEGAAHAARARRRGANGRPDPRGTRSDPLT